MLFVISNPITLLGKSSFNIVTVYLETRSVYIFGTGKNKNKKVAGFGHDSLHFHHVPFLFQYKKKHSLDLT